MSRKKLGPWKRSIYLLEYALFLSGMGILRILPLAACYKIAHILAWGMYTFDFHHTNRAIRNVIHSGLYTEKADAKKLVRANFLHICKMLMEIVKFDQIINEENFSEHFKVAGDPLSQAMLGRGAPQQILTPGHLGNWELSGGIHTKLTGRPMTSIGRPLANPYVNDYFMEKRCSYAHESFPKEKGLRPFFDAFKKGHTLTIVSDQHCRQEEGEITEFFQHPARSHATPALLQLKMGLPITVTVLSRDDDDFHFTFHCIGTFSYTPTGNKLADVCAITQKYTSLLEQGIRRFPEEWNWAHRRWMDLERPSDQDELKFYFQHKDKSL